MKKYENEIKLLESLLNNSDKVHEAQLYIKEQYGLSSLFDDNLSLLYIWNEDKEDDEKILEAQKYINENFDEFLLDIDTNKPNEINENEENEVFVVYLNDKTTAEICTTEEEAKKKVEELNKEWKNNKATYKKEKRSNYVKQ